MIDFEPHEATEYASLEKEALNFYRAFKPRHSCKLSSHYLKLMQKLTPLRIACSGGQIPLSDDCDAAEDDNSEEKSSERKKRGRRGQAKDVAAKPKKAKKVTTYSEFRFQSKFNVLIEELKSIRDKEPDCKLAIEVDFLIRRLRLTCCKTVGCNSQKPGVFTVRFEPQVSPGEAPQLRFSVSNSFR